ncbi:hypothetical protein BURKHO8Y_100010 [Burkholderia sp. 8Y]|nr:hypothetical protein BURKHO8Y_100010 [Burkholderia sp. 8Y]
MPTNRLWLGLGLGHETPAGGRGRRHGRRRVSAHSLRHSASRGAANLCIKAGYGANTFRFAMTEIIYDHDCRRLLGRSPLYVGRAAHLRVPWRWDQRHSWRIESRGWKD